jgi:hypothetical protein
MHAFCLRRLGFVLAIAVASASCSRNEDSEPIASVASALPSASAAGADTPVVAAIPLPREQVLEVVNRSRLAPYRGPTGTVRGRVHAVGDRAPVMREVLEKIPAKCLQARELYQALFREGMMRALADVFVAVTGYEGYLPAPGPAVSIEASGCTWQTRTIGLMFGQRLDVKSGDGETYAPKLVGSNAPAQMFALPGGKAIELSPLKPGRYVLVDESHPFVAADVLVVKYPTFDVTGLDGAFEITGIPPGTVTVGAMLPATRQSAEKQVKVEAGKVVDVELEIRFDASAPAASSAAP